MPKFFLTIAFSLLMASSLVAQQPTVTVEEGFLSRNPRVGTKAHIWAQQNQATRVFAGWSGDVHLLLDPAAPYTTFTVPDASVRLQANYRTVPAWTVRAESLGGVPVSYFVPADPIGLVFVFHGTGGTGAGQFVAAEFLSFMRDLVAAGFGVAAFDCLDRGTGQWNTTITGAGNPDIVRLNAVIAAMRTQRIIGSDLPLVAFGHSNGGFFSHFSAPVMNWKAVAISSVQGSALAVSSYTGPVAWWMPKNDDHPQVGLVGGVATSVSRYEGIVNRGLHARHTIQEAMPLFPERFTRSAIISLADSIEVYNLFKSRAWLDENDFLIRNPNEIEWRAALPARFTETMKTSISAQLEGTFMTHEFTNFAPNLTIDLYLRAIGKRNEIRPVSGASFSGAAIAPNSIATIFTPALAGGLQVASSGPEVRLAGVNAALRSSAGVETPVGWFFVSPGQGSFLVPGGLATGSMTLKINSGDRRVAFPVSIAATAPGIFTANGNGQGAPAAVLLRVKPDNSRSTELPFAAGAAGFEATPIRFGGDRLFLDLYATGVRGATSVEVLLDGVSNTPLYAGAQPQFIGLDQVTLELPGSLAGKGKVNVVIVAGGVRSNQVELNFGN
jgi:uncharacterized protein (TIGR03437 family)